MYLCGRSIGVKGEDAGGVVGQASQGAELFDLPGGVGVRQRGSLVAHFGLFK